MITSRLRRLLPPLWLLGLIAVPIMIYLGWASEEDGEHPLSWATLGFWILPAGEPPGSDQAIDLWEPLWYLRAYLWFVVLSPLMYPIYRRIGWLAVAAPIVALAVLDQTGLTLPETADAAMWDFVTYGACWIAGFAHHDGRLARTRPVVLASIGAALGTAALYWLYAHPGENGYDLNEVAESQALWSLSVVLLVLRWQPPMSWLSRIRPLDAAVTLLNNRAVTVYLWHNIAIVAIWPILAVAALDDLGGWGRPVELLATLILTGMAILTFGWAEDLAALRRPRLWPAGTNPPSPAAEPPAAQPPAEPPAAGPPDPGPPAAEVPAQTLPDSVLRHASAPQGAPGASPPPPRQPMVFPSPPWGEPVGPPPTRGGQVPWSGHDAGTNDSRY